jgi:hypothetical protein
VAASSNTRHGKLTSTIITTHYRYKRPPRKRKAVALEASAIVTAKSSRRPVSGKTAAEVVPPAPKEGAVQPSTPRERGNRSRAR